MTKPPTSVRSIRLPDETWAWLSERAAASDMSVNALIAGLVRLARNPPNAAELRATREIVEKALPKPTATELVTLGRLAPRPGSLLKKR